MITTTLSLRGASAHRGRYVLGAIAVGVAVAFITGGLVLIRALEAQMRVAGADDAGTSAGLFLLLSAFGLVVVVAAGFVIANSFSATVAARFSELALLRAVGMRRRQVYASVMLEGGLVGAVGTVVGLFTGTLAAWAVSLVTMPDGSLPALQPSTALPALGVGLLVTMMSALLPAWQATRVRPVAALSAGPTLSGQPLPRGRAVAGTVLLGVGILAAAVPLGGGPADILVFTVGALVGFVGLAMLAPAAMPALGGGASRASGSAVAKLAIGNLVRSQRRTANASMAVVLGVTLFTGVMVVLHSVLEASRRAGYEPEGVGSTFALASALAGFTIVVALLGVINTIVLSVRERASELALLRTVGMTAREVRRSVTIEGTAIASLGVGAGLMLGLAGAWLLIGRLQDDALVAMPPWQLLAAMAAAVLVIVVMSSRAVAVRATAAARPVPASR